MRAYYEFRNHFSVLLTWCFDFGSDAVAMPIWERKVACTAFTENSAHQWGKRKTGGKMQALVWYLEKNLNFSALTSHFPACAQSSLPDLETICVVNTPKMYQQVAKSWGFCTAPHRQQRCSGTQQLHQPQAVLWQGPFSPCSRRAHTLNPNAKKAGELVVAHPQERWVCPFPNPSCMPATCWREETWKTQIFQHPYL